MVCISRLNGSRNYLKIRKLYENFVNGYQCRHKVLQQRKQTICRASNLLQNNSFVEWTKQVTRTTKPTQSAFVKSLNGKFGNEYLNQRWFKILDYAAL